MRRAPASRAWACIEVGSDSCTLTCCHTSRPPSDLELVSTQVDLTFELGEEFTTVTSSILVRPSHSGTVYVSVVTLMHTSRQIVKSKVCNVRTLRSLSSTKGIPACAYPARAGAGGSPPLILDGAEPKDLELMGVKVNGKELQVGCLDSKLLVSGSKRTAKASELFGPTHLVPMS